MDIEQTLDERGRRYGVFAHHAAIAQILQENLRGCRGWAALEADQRQALTVICDKIARIMNGDPNYIDNWHDIAGYAKLVEQRLEQDNARQVARTLKGDPYAAIAAQAKVSSVAAQGSVIGLASSGAPANVSKA